jgi:hypothetical protein
MTRRWIGVPVLIALVLAGLAAGLSRASASSLPLTGGVLQQLSFPGPVQTFKAVPSPSKAPVGAAAPQGPASPDLTPAPVPSDVAPAATETLSEGTPPPSMDPTDEPPQSQDPMPTATAP